jgi:hypothetical protein
MDRRFAGSARAPLHLLGLWTLAAAQPVLDLLGKNATFFVAHRADPTEIIAAVAGIVFLVPTALALALWLLGRLLGKAARTTATLALVAVLVSALAMLAVKEAGAERWTTALPAAAAAGAAAAWIYLRKPAARTFATLLAVSSIVAPAYFFAQPGVRRVMTQPSTPGEGQVRPLPGALRPGPVLLIVMDEVPLLSLLDKDGLIDAALYPNLAALAGEGVWFRNATAVSDDTRWAVPAIVSGRYPQGSLMPTQADHPDTLFTQLAPTHRLEVVEGVTRLCRFAACNAPQAPLAARAVSLADDLRILYLHRLLTDDLRRTLPVLTGDWARFGVAGAVERRERRAQRMRRRVERTQRGTDNMRFAIDFVGSISHDDPQPSLYFFHSLLPHSPWQWLPSGQRNASRAPIPEAGVQAAAESEWGVALQHQRHLLQIGAVDRVIGLFVERLRSEGLYDRTLVVVASDHGVAFTPGLPRRQFRPETAAEIMPVPLVIKFPEGERQVPGTVEIRGQRISDRNAETIDIGPTVLDVLGLEPTAKPDGASLRRPLVEDRPTKRILFSEGKASRTYPDGGVDLGPALARKAARFGEGNPFRVPRPARFATLVGRPLATLTVQDGGGRMAVDDLSQFTDFRATADAVPFDLSGRLTSPGRGVTWVAVAVNGTVQAVTRTWESEPGRWLATPPLDAWKTGANEVDVFVVSGDERNPLLRATVVEAADGGGG